MKAVTVKATSSYAEEVRYIMCVNCHKHHPRCADCGVSFKNTETLVCKDGRHRHAECEYPREDED